jgi:DNA-binding FadR family transcriptional regulator
MDLFLNLHRQIAETIEAGNTSSIEQVVRAHYVYWRRT